MKQISIREARRRFSEIVDAAERGQSVVITRRGRCVARLGPAEAEGGGPLPDLAALRASIEVRGKPLSETVVDMRGEDRY